MNSFPNVCTCRINPSDVCKWHTYFVRMIKTNCKNLTIPFYPVRWRYEHYIEKQSQSNILISEVQFPKLTFQFSKYFVINVVNLIKSF